MGYYDAAQVCPNGHVANDTMHKAPEFNKAFCPQCGEPTTAACPKCAAEIQGEYHEPGVAVIGFPYHPPAFCHKCGAAFPWTERRKKAALELLIEEEITDEDRRVFEQSVGEITKDTPEAQVASKRILKVLRKVGSSTASAVRDILVDIASEAAKKILLP